MLKKNGFTLFETMIALAIIGIALPTLLGLGSMLFKTVTKTIYSFERVVALKNMFIEAHEKQWWQTGDNKTKHNDFPVMNMTYSVKPVSDKSALKKMKNIVIERIDAQWRDKGERTESLVFLMYKPEKKDASKGDKK